MTKHLRVLGQAGLVQGERHGREVRFALPAGRSGELCGGHDEMLAHWQEALGRWRFHLARGRASIGS